MQRSSALFLLFVAIVALVGWSWWHGEQPLPPLDPGTPTSPSTTPTTSTPPPHRPQEPMPEPSATGLRVRVEVAMRERFVPPPPVRVQARSKVDGTPLTAWVVAGAGAGGDEPATASMAGSALVAIAAAGGRMLRLVTFSAEAPALYEVAGALAVRGTVRGADGMPLRDARVWCGEYGADGQRREAVTDASGEFELAVTVGTGVPCVVQAAGHVLWTRTLDVAAPPPVLDVQLALGCTIDVQVAGFARAMTTARAFVVPRGAVATELAQWPFWLQAADGGVALDAAGRATIAGLPRAGEVAVLVRHPEAPFAAGVPVVLKGERARASVPLAFAASNLTGRVVDQDRRPLAGASLWAMAGEARLVGGNSQRLLPPHLEQRGTWAVAADDGAFLLGVPGDPATVRVLARCPGHAGRDVAAASLGEGALAAGGVLVLPVWLGGEPQFTLAPPAAGVAWTAECDLSGGVRELLAADQSFRLSLPHAGRFAFVLTTLDGADVVAVRTLADVDVTGPIELVSPKRP